MWRVLKFIGWILVGLVFLAVAREGWQQLVLAVLAVPAVLFIWGALGGSDL